MAREIRLDFKIDGNAKETADDLREIALEADKLQAKFDALKTVEVKIKVDDSELKRAMGSMGKNPFATFTASANKAQGAATGFAGGIMEMASSMASLIPMAGPFIKVFTSAFSAIQKGVELLQALEEATSESLGQVTQISAAFNESIDASEYERMTAIIQSSSQATGVEFDKMTEYMIAATKTLKGTAHEAAATAGVLNRMLGQERGAESLEWIQEYSVQFRKLGLDLEAAAAVAINSRALGIYQDKAFDAFKEFGLKINDLSTSEEKVLRDANLFKYFEQIRKGSVPVSEALSKIGADVKKLSDEGKDITPVIKAMFGSAGEDMGAAAVKLFEMTKLTGQLKESYLSLAESEKYLVQSQQASNEQFNKFSTTIGPSVQGLLTSLSAAWNSVKAVFWNVATIIGKEIAPIFNKISGTIRDLVEQAKQGKGIFAELAGLFRGIGMAVAVVIRHMGTWITGMKDGKVTIAGLIPPIFAVIKSIVIFVARIATAENAMQKFFNVLSDGFSIFGSASETFKKEFAVTQKVVNAGKVVDDMEKTIMEEIKKGGAIFLTPDVNVTPTGFGKDGVKSPTGDGKAGESANDKAKRLLDENLFLLEKNADEERKINDHKYAMLEQTKLQHVKNEHKIDKAYVKDNFALYDAFYRARLKLTEQDVINISENNESLGKYLAKLDKDRFEMAKSYFNKRQELKMAELDADNKLKEKEFEIERERVAALKASYEAQVNERLAQRLREQDNAERHAAVMVETEYEKEEIILQGLQSRIRLEQEALAQQLRMEGLSAEEILRLKRESKARIDALNEETINKEIEFTKRRADNLKAFMSEMSKAMSNLSGPLGGAVNKTIKGVEDFMATMKKIGEINKEGGGTPMAGIIAGITLANTALQSFGEITQTIMAEQTKAVDAEIAAQNKQIENVRKLIEAEKARNEEINRRREIENALAENRIEELEQLKTTIPESEREMADKHIALEKAKIVNVEEARKQQEAAQNQRLQAEERKREALEKKKQKMQQKAFEVQRAANIADVVSKGAIAIMTALVQLGPILGAIAGVGIGITTGVNVALIASQRNPYAFEEGTLFVKGGRLGKDSVPAILAGGEAVIPYRTNVDYHDAIRAIYSRSVSPEKMNAAANGTAPSVTISIDENGFNKSIVTAYEKKLIRDKKMHLNI